MLQRFLNPLAALLFRHSVLIDRKAGIEQILKRGYKSRKGVKNKIPQKFKLSIIQRMKLEEKLPKILLELFDIGVKIKDVKYQVKVERQKIKKNHYETLKKKVEKGIATNNALIYSLFDKAVVGDFNDLISLKKELDSDDPKHLAFKKSIIPLLNKHRDISKHRPITSLRKHVVDELIKRVNALEGAREQK